ncbi:hypothetical protein [Plantactinospora sp. B24E8]|uniref:hypothetical protein n=1 Tax=Plantactinospora sp. B24E8 TaxID=3153567 RepID=UPI00325E8E44
MAARRVRTPATITAGILLLAATTSTAVAGADVARATGVAAVDDRGVAVVGPAAGRWHLDDYGSPVTEATYLKPVGAVSVQQSIDGEQRPWMFTIIAGQLYAAWSDQDGPQWLPLGAPPKSEIFAPVGVVTVQDNLYAPQRPYVFVQTLDGHLWLNWFNGVDWPWLDLGTPPPTKVADGIGVVSVRNGFGLPQRPYVFVLGVDGHLWLNWWNGGGWQWDDQGTPTDGTLLPYGARVGVVNLRLTPEGADWPQAFLLDNQRQVWRNGWDGGRWTWTNHGTPHGMSMPDSRGLGALAVRDTSEGAAWPHAFVSAYGSVYELSGAGGDWRWVYHSDPVQFEFLNPVGAVTVQDKPSVGDRPYLFVVDRYGGPVWSNWWAGRSWEWVEQAGTDAEMLGYQDSGSAVTIQDTPESPQRPYVFYWSSSWPRKLMVNWWG